MIVAFPAGGPVDFVARTISEPLGHELNARILIENKPGGNGTVAAEYLASQAADGKTLWLSSVGAISINPTLYSKLSYDPLKDLAPISLVVNNVELLVVNPNNPVNNGAEFVTQAKTKSLTMASTGKGGVPHLAMEQLAESTKTNLLHVPYKGAAPAITDVMAGHVDGFFGDIPGLIGFIKSGKLKPIALASNKRSSIFPQVKTFAELGIEGVDSNNWYGLFAKQGTKSEDIVKLNKAIFNVLNQTDIKNKLLDSGTDPSPSSPENLTKLVKSDLSKWGTIIKSKNIKED
jgi:tripartite-type tricarboxylate transporter receptor subunit TctC